LVVSNRLPVRVARQEGGLTLEPSTGGLATGLGSVCSRGKTLWFGWPGMLPPREERRSEQQVRRRLDQLGCWPVFLTRSELAGFYRGFSNATLWPIFHYFNQHAEFDQGYWRIYRRVNERFRDEVLKAWRDGDRVWVHDYQLLLLPGMLRERLPDAEIGFFLHIPFPSYEVFRALPWRRELLAGMLGADLVGFHTYDYVRHFVSSASRMFGLEHRLGRIGYGGRELQADVFPMGIDYDRFARAARSDRVSAQAEKNRAMTGGARIVLSVDRLDYTKGIVQRLEAYAEFLGENPSQRGKVSLVLLVVPSRTRVAGYRELKERVDELVGRINGRFGGLRWTPIHYLYRSVPFETLVSYYRAADVCLVTPVRDGMNLVAKEFLASRPDSTGVRVLSEMAGAAAELGEALQVNPLDRHGVAETLAMALAMPADDQARRNRLMQERLRRYDVQSWAADFLERLAGARRANQQEAAPRLTGPARKKLLGECRSAKRRLLLLDYDGTLVGFADRPEQATPDRELLALLGRLATDRRKQVVVISGRPRQLLEEWFGAVGVALVAEHGAWDRAPGDQWRLAARMRGGWKRRLRPMMERYVDRTPGALLEEKEFALAWHYRMVAPELADVRSNELAESLLELTANLGIEVLRGNKVIEARPAGVSKGDAARRWLARENWDFVLALGDDRTDDAMFAALPDGAYPVRVGVRPQRARFGLADHHAARDLLRELEEC